MFWIFVRIVSNKYPKYSKTCVRQPPLKLTLVVDVERWLSYKGTCHVHDMYLYKTANFFPHQPLFKVSLEGGSLTQVLLYMFYEEKRTKQAFSYISICSLSMLYNSKFTFMAISLGTNAVVVTTFTVV